MAFGVTPEGFKAKKFEDIVTEIGTSLLTQLGIDIDADPDSIAKVLTNIYALSLAEEWALPQALQSMFDIDKAEGVHLDNLVGFNGIVRNQAIGSFGDVYISSTTTVDIGVGSAFSDVEGNLFFPDNTIPVGLNNCINANLDLNSAVVGETLSLSVGQTNTSVVITTTIENAITSFVAGINNNNVGILIAEDTTVGTDYSINLVVVDDKSSVVVSVSSNITLIDIISSGRVSREIEGTISVPVNTVTVLPSITGLTASTNRYLFTKGNLQETDIELRNRYKLALSRAGAATVEGITSDVRAVAGVTSTNVIENDTLLTDALGIPPKAFLTVVEGGGEEDIAEAIWLSKPAGIETDGEISVNIIDSTGRTQAINFSRPTDIYIYVNVNYSLYEEESNQFPISGEEDIAAAVLAYGDSLIAGVDVIPQRISSEIFNRVGGLSVANVTVGKTFDAGLPTPPLSTNIISISDISVSNFDSVRITVNEI